MAITILTEELTLELVQCEKEFPIDFEDAWQWCGYSKKSNAKRRLTRFKKGVDYIEVKEKRDLDSCSQKSNGLQGGDSSASGVVWSIKIYMTVDCFKMFAMMAETEKGDEVRMYFLRCEKRLKEILREQTATYYQTRQQIIESLVPAKPLTWQKRYEDEFWQHLYRLTKYKQGNPQCAKFINKHIYNYFEKDVRDRLDEVNPLIFGKRKRKQHQHLEGFFLDSLLLQIVKVVTLMKSATCLEHFEQLMTASFCGIEQHTIPGLKL